METGTDGDGLLPLPSAEQDYDVDEKALRLEREAGEVYAALIEDWQEWREHRKKQGDHDRISQSAMNKQLEVAAKFRNIEIALMLPRLQREHVLKLMEHEREMARSGRREAAH